MLIGVRNRFVFVANTKTASTSIEHALAPHAEIMRGGGPARKHMGLAEILAEYDFLFGQEAHRPEDYFKFGVMRDPVEWILSWYRYRRGNTVEHPLPPGMDFAAFWHRADWNIRRRDGSPNLQSDRFTDARGAVLADVILPYSGLQEGFSRICAALGITAGLPQRNVSQMRRIEGGLPAGLLEEMRGFYAADYALYDRLDEINARGLARLEARAAALRESGHRAGNPRHRSSPGAGAARR